MRPDAEPVLHPRPVRDDRQRRVHQPHVQPVTRNRETIYGDYIFRVPSGLRGHARVLPSRHDTFHIEGGDILNINEHVLAIGISQRTEPDAIDAIAHNIFNDETSPIDTILAFNIPVSRAFMHLDTVFTQIDRDKFTIHPGIMGPLTVFEITPDGKGGTKIRERNEELSRRAVRVRRREGARSFPAAAATASRPSASSGTTAPTPCACAPAPWWCTSATTSPTTCCTRTASTVWSCRPRSLAAAVAARAACPCRPGARLCSPHRAQAA